MKKKLKEQKGITLIALIITIIVLLILAVVSINIVRSEGLIARAKNATKTYTDEQELEGVNLATADAKIANNGGEVTYANLETALNSQFTNGVTFTNTTSPYKFTVNNGTGNTYTVYSDGYVQKTVIIGNEEILSKYPLSGTVKDGVYTFDNDNLPNAYDYILSKYGKTVKTTDALTSALAVNKLNEIYKTQEGLDQTALDNALQGNYLVNVDGKVSYYSSDFGYLTSEDFTNAVMNNLTDEEKQEMENDTTGTIGYKFRMNNIGFMRNLQIQYASGLVNIKSGNNYLIFSDAYFSDSYEVLKKLMSYVFPGGWITSDTIKNETTNKASENLESFIKIGVINVEQIQDTTDISLYSMILLPNESEGTVITDENKEEIKKQIKGKIVYYVQGETTNLGVVATNLYFINLETGTACYTDSNGNIIEGKF